MKDEIKKIVKKLVKKYKTRNPFEIADKLGIWIYVIDLGNTKGHYIYAKRKKVIFVNNKLTDNEILFSIAHELGHALLHVKSNVYFNSANTFFNQNKHEIEADTFAAELCINDSILDNYEGYTIETISACENIEIKYLKYKFDKNMCS